MNKKTIIILISLFFVFSGITFLKGQTPVRKKIVPQKSTSKLIFIRKNTDRIIRKMAKHLPATLNECTLAKWTMKDPRPSEDPSTSNFASIWKTSFDGMQVQINSSVSPGYTGLIISGIKLTFPARTGYSRTRVSNWIKAKYGNNTRVGSTEYFIEYMTNCWLIFRLNQRSVVVELKWMG